MEKYKKNGIRLLDCQHVRKSVQIKIKIVKLREIKVLISYNYSNIYTDLACYDDVDKVTDFCAGERRTLVQNRSHKVVFFTNH